VERVGFIGLGIMGRPMAQNLLRAGYPLVVHNRSRAAVEALVAAGAERASTPREVAERSDVVITVVPDSPDVEAVVLGPDGVAEGARAGMLLIDMSTVAPATARRLAAAMRAKGADALDAPVSGGQAGAEQGTLSIMAGGSAESFARARPIFEVLGRNVVHVGDAGAGQVAKACNQLVVAATIAAVSEALVLAAKSGVDPARVREALLGGFAQSRILEAHGLRMLERRFEPGFRVRLQLKDVRIVTSTGRALGVPLPVAEAAEGLLAGLVESGGGELDHSALVTAIERQAGCEVGGSSAGAPAAG
jgi:2-hydroxy-3-oxopropionate reductase